MILDRIAASKRSELRDLRTACPLSELRCLLPDAPPPRDFASALGGPPGHPLRVIAEFKRASPSKGTIRADLAPADVARRYEAAGASAMSVLTDGPFFSGSLQDLRDARSAVSLPVLRKDFTLDAYHLYEARAAGADAVLLIAALLDAAQLKDFQELAEGLGMAALVEVHDEGELEKALAASPRLLGVNNRNLQTFAVDLATTERLRSRVPAGVILVSESGIACSGDAARLQRVGVDAILVGEGLMRQPDPGRALRALLQPEPPI